MPTLSVLSVTDALTDELRARIVGGDLVPGDALAEVGLARDYDVARPTAKAALERLISEGLLEKVAHKSAQVPVMDIPRIHDMYFARKLVECQVYRLLAKRRSIPDEAVTAIDSLRGAAEEGALSHLVDADVRFHRSLVDDLGSLRVSKTHGALINEMRLCLVQVQAHKLLDPMIIAGEHAAILDAIRIGNEDLAADLGEVHLERAEAKLTGYFSEK